MALGLILGNRVTIRSVARRSENASKDGPGKDVSFDIASFKIHRMTHNPKRNMNWRLGDKSEEFFIFPKGL